ncbi:heterokaryon incompatibility protein-domain-containing protein [Dactylonectria estremocensis]|uniref:Heterokaryon incompatibility protein-domain-containing protein n=1 Tax=Dactylonectria estremocensis TaxID=1079267 RepID=A0A9P9DIZ0_9HYPO|nr:heterokaryon incompatibility protein-domain-containing protein [Dactylonectria estremocensis]
MQNDGEDTCEVCATILDIYMAEFQELDDDVLGEVSEVLDGDCPHTDSIRRAANFDRPITDYPNRLLAIKKEPDQTATRLGLAEVTPEGNIVFDNVSTTPMELVARNDQPSHPGRGILPDPEWINLDTILSWASRCNREHGDRCGEPRWFRGVEAVDPEWLVDVVQGCVVASPAKGTNYTALSYTWGQCQYQKNTESLLKKLQQPGILATGQFASQLPPTIRNAMAVVKSLGQRYIWIDALCIIQDDLESLTRNLNQMQLIYANAVFCIMGATGSGADFGLRGLKGVSHPRDLELRVYELADGDKLAAGSLSLDPSSGAKHSYFQRSWTFQEWLFARRRIVFNHGPLMWQCQSAQWYEHLEINPQADEKWALHAQEKFGPSPSVWNLMPTVATFNTKSLTVSDDAPKAFAGIQAMLHRVHPGGVLFGLSEFFFDIFLLWSSLYSDIDRRITGDAASTGLPSWSWIGWQGDISFPYDAEFRFIQPWHYHEHKIGFREPVTEWFTMKSPNATHKRKVRSQWHKYKTKSTVGQHLETLEGWDRRPLDSQHQARGFKLPGSEPTHVYFHKSDTPQEFRYEVPVLQWATTPALSEQTPYLFCETSHMRISITQQHLITGAPDYERRVQIKHKNTLVISLSMPSWNLAEEFVSQSRGSDLEFIAVGKGWSTWLGDDIVHEAEQTDGDQSYLRAPGMNPRDCYFILLIETINDIAYRRASGEALESWWDKNTESQPTQVVLG